MGNHLIQVPLQITDDPGVVQLDWVMAFGKQYLGIRNTFSEMHQLKFQKPILPGCSVKLSLSSSSKKNILGFRYFTDRETFSSGRISYLPLIGADD